MIPATPDYVSGRVQRRRVECGILARSIARARDQPWNPPAPTPDPGYSFNQPLP